MPDRLGPDDGAEPIEGVSPRATAPVGTKRLEEETLPESSFCEGGAAFAPPFCVKALAAPGKFLSARSFELAPPRLGPGMPSAVLRSRSQPLLDLWAPVVVAERSRLDVSGPFTQ